MPQDVTLVVLDQDAQPGFSLRACVLGEGGQNLRHITEVTGVRISLVGQGAGKPGVPELEGPMRLVLSATHGDRLKKAVELAKDLVEYVREKHQQARRTREEGSGKGNGKGKGKGSDDSKGKGKGDRTERHGGGGGRGAQADAARDRMRQAAMEARQDADELAAVAEDAKARAAEKQKEMWSLAGQQELMTNEVKDAARAAVAGTGDPRLFWQALEQRRAVVAVQSRSTEFSKARQELSQLRSEADTFTKRAKERSCEAKKLETVSKVAAICGSSSSRRCCSLFAAGACPFGQGDCPRGSHEVPGVPEKQEVFTSITKAKMRLLQQKWEEAGGRGQLQGAWQVRNPRLEFLFRGAEANFFEVQSHTSDVIDAWHGSAEANVFSIARHGFDPSRRCGQAYGAGEYFAKDPNVSIAYARGGSFMFLCKLMLGQVDKDHTWHAGPKYYVIKQREGRMQALPIFLLQFKAASACSQLARELKTHVLLRDSEEGGSLASQQRGGLCACPARRDAGMTAESTRHLWLGWLDPKLRFHNDDVVAEDVSKFLEGHAVNQVVPERNGARIGAFVLLRDPVDRSSFAALASRRYRGEFRISVDDAQPANPRCRGRVCPRLAGPSRYCRGWNIRGHAAWQWGCSYDHPEDARPTHGAEYTLEQIPNTTAKFDEIQTEMRRSMPGARVLRVQRVQNLALEKLYEERRRFIHDKQGFAVEKELWHGTSCEALPTLLRHGLQPPSDTCPSEACPTSGGKGLCTTLCGTGCQHCTQEHHWNRCHMYGLGVYLADVAAKSHQYVRKPTRGEYSMLWCRVCLGNPYLVEGNLLTQSALHDTCWCQDPSEGLESLAEEWSVTKGHDAYYVKGLSGKQKHGLGVFNNEYIVFQPYQILPLYRVDYTC